MQVELYRGHRDLLEALERDAADFRQALQEIAGSTQNILSTTNLDAVKSIITSLQTVCSVSFVEDSPTRLI